MRNTKAALALPIIFTALLSAALLGTTRSVHAAAAAPLLTTVFAFPATAASGDSACGASPTAGLTQGSDGNLYGTTAYGGANGTGTVYKITPSGAITTLYSFSDNSNNENPDGAYPADSLVQGSDGNLYGTTEYGGANNTGTIFKITPSGSLTTLYTFSWDSDSGNADGAYPSAGLIQASDGNFYGMTANGGANDYGSLYQITPTGAQTTLYSFDFTHGAFPLDTLAQGSDGNLYGTTEYGGASAYGTVFKCTLAGALTVLHSFSDDTGGVNADGAMPSAGLAQGADGNFYGATEYGGAGATGTLFQITPAGALTTLHSFSGDYSGALSGNLDGAYPKASPTLGPAGVLYGTTAYGGVGDGGTVYAIAPPGVFTTLYSFSSDASGANSDGAQPIGSLTSVGTDLLYGATSAGGPAGSGTVFGLSLSGVPIATTGSGSGGAGASTPALEPRFDFNHDGHADLVWYNTGTGGVSVWDMDDQSVLSYGAAFAQVDPASGWLPAAAPDVNGDGYPDLLWWNSFTGEMSFWTLQNTTPQSYGGAFATLADTTWKPVAAADVTGAAWELVFQNTATGDISAWQMNGETPVSYGGTLASLGPNSPWQVVGAPDIDGDNHSDLLFWNDQTGEVSWWGASLASNKVLSYNGDIAQVNDTTWHLIGSEDTDGDGHPDLVWWNAASGVVSRWLMNGPAVIQYAGASTRVADTTWQPTALR